MVSAANVTSIVEKLVEDGYITRSQSHTDRRTQIIRMRRGTVGLPLHGARAFRMDYGVPLRPVGR